MPQERRHQPHQRTYNLLGCRPIRCRHPRAEFIPAEDIAVIAETVRDRDLIVLSGEIYSRLCYCGGFPVSIASMPGMADKTIVLFLYHLTYPEKKERSS